MSGRGTDGPHWIPGAGGCGVGFTSQISHLFLPEDHTGKRMLEKVVSTQPSPSGAKPSWHCMSEPPCYVVHDGGKMPPGVNVSV